MVVMVVLDGLIDILLVFLVEGLTFLLCAKLLFMDLVLVQPCGI